MASFQQAMTAPRLVMFDRDSFKPALKTSRHHPSVNQFSLDQQMFSQDQAEQMVLKQRRGLQGMRLDSTKSCALKNRKSLLTELEFCSPQDEAALSRADPKPDLEDNSGYESLKRQRRDGSQS
jgi:hypothetical protein